MTASYLLLQKTQRGAEGVKTIAINGDHFCKMQKGLYFETHVFKQERTSFNMQGLK